MGPKGKSKSRFAKGQLIGQIAHARKLITSSCPILNQLSTDLHQQEIQINNQISELKDANTLLHANRIKLKRKQDTLDSINVTLDELKHETSAKKPRLDNSFAITQRVTEYRQNNPSTSSSSANIRYKRQHETITACAKIHGIHDSKSTTLLSTMFDTLCSHFSNLAVTNEILNTTNDPTRPPNSQSVSNLVKSKIIMDSSKSYHKSETNKYRSLFTFYSGKYIMSARQYQALCKSNRQSTLISSNDTFAQHLPNFIVYKELQYIINNVNIGETHSTLTIDGMTRGCYRRLNTFTLRLAQFYLERNITRQDKLTEFPNIQKRDSESFLFILSFGGDAAPACGTSFFLAFINIGIRLDRSSEHFLVFGADCDES